MSAKAERNNARVKMPKYCAGDTYYLSHKHGTPARIVIEAVYMKSTSKEWMYSIYSEANSGRPSYIPESILSQRISKHTSEVYKNPEIIDRYNNGYRFCGNYDRDTAISRGKEFACSNHIQSVLLHQALDGSGNKIDGQYGIWIRWNTVITGNGMNDISDTIKIK